MSFNQPKSIAGIDIPDSQIARQATELIMEYSTEFLYNHSVRVFLFASLNGERNSLEYDRELLYVCSIFHDFGLVPHYRSLDKRFEVDGANAVREFLKGHGLPEPMLQLTWDTIALHTTLGVAEYKEPLVALMYSGVNLDVTGEGYDNLSKETRGEITKAFPRTDFKKKIVPIFFAGYSHKTDTTFGNIKADVCAFMVPHFHKRNFVESIMDSPWSE